MRGKMISFPTYNPSAYSDIKVPDVRDTHIRQTLADCWELTKNIKVPQFREGECEVRRLWEEAVAEAMAGIPRNWLTSATFSTTNPMSADSDTGSTPTRQTLQRN